MIMTNVLQPQIDFHPRPVAHAPSPFGFGFGLGAGSSPSMAATGWQPSGTASHTHLSAFPQTVSSMGQASVARSQKRRHEEDEQDGGRYAGVRDDSMDRSPTPERPKRAAPKRARVSGFTDGQKDSTTKENKAPNGDDNANDVDVGVLLASLPSQSLLPLLTSLLSAHPSLKTTILPLIPRPTLETAIQTLAQSAKKLRDAYPYSNSPSLPTQSTTSPSFGFARPSHSQNQSIFGQSPQTSHTKGGMRESYIISRLRPHINDFVAACISYLPYFSYLPALPSASTSTFTPSNQSAPPHSSALQALHKDKSHPSETFIFLSAVTDHLLSQPPLTQSQLGPLILPRLCEEWKAWINRVDEVVNRQGGMFGIEVVRSWERGLDDFAGAKWFEGGDAMRAVRDLWITKVGWLVGRIVQQPMEEL